MSQALSLQESNINFFDFIRCFQKSDMNQIEFTVKFCQQFPELKKDAPAYWGMQQFIAKDISAKMLINSYINNENYRIAFYKNQNLTIKDTNLSPEKYKELLEEYPEELNQEEQSKGIMCFLDNDVPVISLKWVTLEQFCNLSGLTADQMKSRKAKGDYDETIIKVKKGRLMVNVRAHDAWMDRDE